MTICAQRLTDVGAITEAEGRSERWNVPSGPGVPILLKSRMPRSEYAMNIFYIIGVVVVIVVIAGFLGLHV
jgi:hypothetical protein